MEIQNTDDLEKPAATAYHSNIDSSRPFRSVKEAVAIFGERFLAGDICAPKRFDFPQQETPVCYYTPSPSPQKSQGTSWRSFTSPQKSPIHDDCNEQQQPMMVMESLKKLEAELEETKMELRQLKERESETEVALASLNAELHKNMSKLAQAEAAAASKALMAASRSNSVVPERNYAQEEKKKDLIVRLESSTTLAQFLNTGDHNTTTKEDHQFYVGRMKKEKKLMKKKPIIPLVGDLFSRKKGNSTTLNNPLFSSSQI